MANGMVTTARGAILNMDELISKGAQPIGAPAKSTRTNAGYTPNTNTTPSVRGFVPTGGTTVPPVMDTQPVTVGDTVIKTSFTEDGTATTLNDITGVKVKAAKKTAPKGQPVSNAEADAELGNLLGKLKKPKK